MKTELRYITVAMLKAICVKLDIDERAVRDIYNLDTKEVLTIPALVDKLW